ncbi:hypothetical protein ACVW0Q_002387 [Thermostichus sp. MS-CIW-21]|uniref:Uma2 family endonuclease n=1 Tax=unclassified Synechococcus TaxID=2626047 RepID=UPI0000693F2F|nr:MULTISPECIES: Uma2 family endonuclease [unclassified Synechococcus]ABC98368.1 conserved hypothetical protein, truncation [Synechococcus sp. JA-3-3Ab]
MDDLVALQATLQKYLDNGAQLGWLIDPESRRIYIYRPGQPVQVLERPAYLQEDSLALPWISQPNSALKMSKALYSGKRSSITPASNNEGKAQGSRRR